MFARTVIRVSRAGFIPRGFLAARTLAMSPPTFDSASSSQPPSTPRSRPGPPPLPRALQREFEALQKKAQTVDMNVPDSDIHQDLRRKPKPDFDGEVNPQTGEVGGPKKDPLLGNEWTYGGRATDF
ncbi:Protein of unknown function DUF1674 [Phaffia rhodozyma]|uniref:Succinate dehydrogenase assembly factor 4, mitochondrial n=1 Tax=Phaffia rhodozyma TaxID=264483 RepID=A0A0F7SIS3_PHARH|nr:Protein of unknown function DUF1674 [Phaffia rhodozyma]